MLKNTRVSEVSLLGELATSMRRLWIASAVVLGGMAAYGLFVRRFLMEVSGQVGLNMFLLALQFLGIVLAGYVLAMLFGAMLFGDRWRRRALVGERLELTEEESDAEIMGRMQDNALPFYGLIGVGTVVAYIFLSVVTGGYFEDYNNKGFFRTLLRSEVPADHIQALRGAVNPVNPEAGSDAEVRRLLVERLVSGTPETQAWAAWAAGHLQVVEARDGLLALLEEGEGEVRVEAAIALGRLADPLGERRMIAMLSTSGDDPELAGALLRGLGLARSHDAGPAMAGLLGVVPVEQEVTALWAIGQGGRTDMREAVLALWRDGAELVVEVEVDAALTSTVQGPLRSMTEAPLLEMAGDDGLLTVTRRDPLLRQCAVAEALKYVSTVEDDAMLREAFASTRRDLYCYETAWDGRSFKDGDRFHPVLMIIGESLRMKYLKAVFNIGAPELEPWLVDIAWDESESQDIRVMADQLAGQIRNGAQRLPRE